MTRPVLPLSPSYDLTVVVAVSVDGYVMSLSVYVRTSCSHQRSIVACYLCIHGTALFRYGPLGNNNT